MAQNPADGPSGTSFGTENEDLINANAPFEIPGLFSEFEGVTSLINTPFQASSQFSAFNAMLDESVPDTPVTEHTHDISEADESRSLDISDYVQLLESPDFVNPEQRREELETDVPEIEDDDILEQEPMAMPDELFTANDTDSYAEMFSAAADNLFSGSESEQGNENSDENKPLYRNAPLTVAESLLLVVTFAIRYTLSGSALNDLLILISLHCISPNLCRRSLHQFQHFFRSVKNPLVYHRYCSYCFLLVDDRATVVCPNSLCSRDLTRSNSCSFFIEIPIVSQIRNLFSKSDFYDNLGHRFRRAKTDINCFEDIYDGSEYKKHCSPGILDFQHNVSLLWNTDGVPVFKLSKFSIWPLYFIINELPFGERTKRENMLFAGLWFGDTKPFMLTFLQPFHSSLRKLETEGVVMKLKLGNDTKEIRSKVILLAGTCDLPAKCLVCNSVQYNGSYGCFKCKQKGQSVKVSARGHVHAFPFIQPDPYGPKRTHLETLQDADKAVKTSAVVDGIKGPSWFAGLSSYDIIKGTAIDYMHGLCLGVMKTMMNLWFASENSNKPFSISELVSKADKRLLEIHPPLEIGRTPRSIEHHRKYWKASELRSFLLYYGMPVLFGILGANYFHHFAILSQASFILLQDSISEQELQQCERLLEYFCLMFPYLYELRYQTINIHNLLHLPQSVRELGPLWTHSCFHFEDKNGYILKMIHGTQNVSSQIVTAVSFVQNLPQMVESLRKNHSDAGDFYQRLTGAQNSSQQTQIMHNTYALGARSSRELAEDEFAALADVLGYIPDSKKVLAFTRLRKGKEIFHSSAYKKVTVRNSYTVLYRLGETHINFGQILYFFQYKPSCPGTGSCMFNCTCHAFNYVVIQELNQRHDPHFLSDNPCDMELSHVVPVTKGAKKVIPLSNIVTKCVFLSYKEPDLGEAAFVARFPNKLEQC